MAVPDVLGGAAGGCLIQQLQNRTTQGQAQYLHHPPPQQQQQQQQEGEGAGGGLAARAGTSSSSMLFPPAVGCSDQVNGKAVTTAAGRTSPGFCTQHQQTTQPQPLPLPLPRAPSPALSAPEPSAPAWQHPSATAASTAAAQWQQMLRSCDGFEVAVAVALQAAKQDLAEHAPSVMPHLTFPNPPPLPKSAACLTLAGALDAFFNSLMTHHMPGSPTAVQLQHMREMTGQAALRQAAGSSAGDFSAVPLSVDASNLIGAISFHNQSVHSAHAAQQATLQQARGAEATASAQTHAAAAANAANSAREMWLRVVAGLMSQAGDAA
ncbi:hypothetical protein V8C86DRAFT_2767671 [Haematococcus lacustris]